MGMLNLPKQQQQEIHNLLKKHSYRNLLIPCTASQLYKCTNSALFWHLSETEFFLQLRITEPSRTRVCGESVGHRGVVKSNALSTAEFDPLESNRQGLALLLRCSAASPIPPVFSPSSRMLLFLSKQRLKPCTPIFDFQIQALQETPGNSYLGSTGKHFTASNCHFHAFNCLWKCYSSKTCSDWCVTKPQWILTLGSLNGGSKRISLRTQILNLPLQNRGSEKNNPGSSTSQTLSKQPISCFHFWGVSDHSGSDRCCTLNTSIWLWIRSTERCFSPHTQLSLPIYCSSDEWS